MRFKQIFLGVGLTAALALSSCEKVIDVQPEFVKDGSAIFKTLDDYEFALTGAYALLRQTGYFGSGAQTTSSWGVLPDMMSDNLVRTTEDLANWATQANFNYKTDEADIEIAWQVAYRVIAQTNLTLRNIDQFSTGNDAKRVNRIKGQALALRAMAHFDLLRYWAVSYDRNSTDLGISYITEVDINLKPARLSVKESYDKILQDMLQAETLLSDVDKAINTATNRYNIDVAAVRGLLSRIYLYSKEYANAEKYADLVIAARPLTTRANFASMWSGAAAATHTEIIFAVAFNPGEGSPSSGLYNAPSHRNRFRVVPAVEALYDQTNDIRFSTYLTNRTVGTSTKRVLNKFNTKTTPFDNIVDWRVLRTAEMYLIRAEARAMQGNATGAIADLNTLRAARIANYTPLEGFTGQALLNFIQDERRRELLGEGHRFFDLKRTTKTLNRTTCTGAGIAVTTCSVAATAPEWAWPIPAGEITANPNIVQTPGY